MLSYGVFKMLSEFASVTFLNSLPVLDNNQHQSKNNCLQHGFQSKLIKELQVLQKFVRMYTVY